MLNLLRKPRAATIALRQPLVRWHPDEGVCRKIERFGALWRALAAAKGHVPTRNDFDPIVVPDLLPSLMMIEALGDAERHRVRLAGTRIAAGMGSDITGYDLQNLPREDGARALAAGVDLCFAQQRPIPGEFTLAAAAAQDSHDIAGFRFLAAPLAATREAPAMALVLVLFVAFDGREVAPQWLGMPTVP
jgi:hypothetical protein